MKYLITLLLSFSAHAGDLYISDDEQVSINEKCELYVSGHMTDQEIEQFQAQLDQAAADDGSYEITVNELCTL